LKALVKVTQKGLAKTQKKPAKSAA